MDPFCYLCFKEHSAILSTFIRLPFLGRFTQVLLYMHTTKKQRKFSGRIRVKISLV